MGLDGPQRLGGGALGYRAEDRTGARLAVIFVDLDVNAEEEQRLVGKFVMAAEAVDYADVRVGIEEFGAEADSGERDVPRLRIGEPVHPVDHRGRVGGHRGAEQLGARNSDRFAKFEVEFRMGSVRTRDTAEFLFDQILDNRFARREVVTLSVNETEDIGIVRLVTDEELSRPVAEL